MKVLPWFLSVLFVLSVRAMENDTDALARLLHDIPLWGDSSAGSGPTRVEARLAQEVTLICKYSHEDIRAALYKYLLSAPRQRPLEIAYLSDAKIISGVLFNVPDSHPYKLYYMIDGKGDLHINPPMYITYYMNFNRDDFHYEVEMAKLFAEFDRLERQVKSVNSGNQ